MLRTFACALGVGALVAGAAGMIGSAAQDQTRQPGQATQARVWIQNRAIADAVPVTVHNDADNRPLRVQITGTPTVAIQPGPDGDRVVPTRAARQAWEYRAVSIAAGQDPVPALNGAGADGWEATGVTTTGRNATIIVLKRPK